MMVHKLVLLFLPTMLFCSSRGARILGIFPMAAPSHYILGNALMKGLAEAGHNVTIISPFEEKDPPKEGSYRDIVLTGFAEDYENMLKAMNLLESKNQSVINAFFGFIEILIKVNDNFFAHENVQKLLKADQKFDLVIVEQFVNDGIKIFGHIYNAPVIAFSSLGPNLWINQMTGNPQPLSYIPHTGADFSPPMSFTDRLANTIFYLFGKAMDKLYIFPEQNKLLKKYFPNPPDVYELYYNVSFVLLNSHESLNQPVPAVPNMAQIGGFHVRPPKKLPKDLQEYLDDAKEGVILFSLGSNLRSKNVPAFKRDALLKAFGKLKEKVLWKWEDDDMPGKPSNVKLAKWLPQQDIIAHPNVKLFITHSGLLSITETVYHGVPILAIPVFGDQHMNAKLAVDSGYALSLPYEDPSFSEEKLSELLQELLKNPKYRDNVKKRSQLFHDRPLKPMQSAVYWVEYVIRNKGAPHLKVAGANLPWYIYHSLDVISFIIILSSLGVHIFYIIIRRLLNCCGICHSKKSKSKND